MAYTLGQAALAVGKSKGALSKAIKTGRISAKKLDNGSYSIEPSELFRVYSPLPSPTEVNSEPTPQNERLETPKETPRNTQNSNELIELRVKLEAAEKRISDLETDKDAWREQARVLALAPPQKKSWLGKIFSS